MMAQLPKGHEIDKSWFEEAKDAELYGRSPIMDALPAARFMTAMDMARAADETAFFISRRGADGPIHDVVRLDNFKPSPGAQEEAMNTLTFSQKIDQDIARAFDIGTVSNAQGQPSTLNVDILNQALRLLDSRIVPDDKPMTASEVRARMENVRGNWHRHWDTFSHDLFMYGAANMLLPGNTAKKFPRPGEQDEFHWMANLPEMLKRGAFTAWLLNDNCKVWDESDRMGHCLFRSYRARMEKGEYIAYHVEAPHLFKNGFTVTLQRGGDLYFMTDKGMKCHNEQRWDVDQVRGKANSTSRDGPLQLFVDHLALSVNNAWKAMHGIGPEGPRGP